MVLIPIAVICIFGVIAVLVWFNVLKKRVMDTRHTFNQLDLLDEDDNSAQELDEEIKS